MVNDSFKLHYISLIMIKIQSFNHIVISFMLLVFTRFDLAESIRFRVVFLVGAGVPGTDPMSTALRSIGIRLEDNAATGGVDFELGIVDVSN